MEVHRDTIYKKLPIGITVPIATAPVVVPPRSRSKACVTEVVIVPVEAGVATKVAVPERVAGIPESVVGRRSGGLTRVVVEVVRSAEAEPVRVVLLRLMEVLGGECGRSALRESAVRLGCLIGEVLVQLVLKTGVSPCILRQLACLKDL